jgi:hypothetical protein
MNAKQIEKLWREAGDMIFAAITDGLPLRDAKRHVVFAELVAAAERERIAKRFELEPGASRHFASAIRNSAPAAGEDV